MDLTPRWCLHSFVRVENSLAATHKDRVGSVSFPRTRGSRPHARPQASDSRELEARASRRRWSDFFALSERDARTRCVMAREGWSQNGK